MTGDNGRERESEAWWEEQGGRIVGAWWVGALKIPLMCPLHSPACDLRAPDSQKVLKHASVLTLQPHTCERTHTCSTHTHTHI